MIEQQRLIGAGLPNVYLANGYTVTGSGEHQAMAIRNVDGLYAAIAEAICMSPAELTPEELRFLRKRLEMSQETLGLQLGKTSQAVAKWEKRETPMPTADGMVTKMLWLQRFRPQLRVRDLPLAVPGPVKDSYVFEVSLLDSWSECAPSPRPPREQRDVPAMNVRGLDNPRLLVQDSVRDPTRDPIRDPIRAATQNNAPNIARLGEVD